MWGTVLPSRSVWNAAQGEEKDIDSAVMILSDDNDNVYQEPNPVATPSNILHSGTLTVISLMERAITKLRTLTGRNT